MIGICEDFRKSVLQAAIQGKLTKQLPEDGNAEDLYKGIQAEKQRLIKEGKIKKEKPLPEISEDDIPFDIPENWKWVQFGDVVNIVSARRVHQSDWKSSGIPFYRAREIAKLAIDGHVDNDLYISKDLYSKFSSSGVPQSGDLMVTAVVTLGKTYIVQPSDIFYYKDASVICLENRFGMNSRYLKYIMESDMLWQQITSNSSGTTVATLTMERMIRYVIPLPPFSEQMRIVARVDELMKRIDEMEKTEKDIIALYDAFPGDMKAALLQAAIQGKLTEQLDSDGNAEDLYREIQAEKQRLIKEGKIKKEKALPEITEDDIPFDIPENWKWIRLGECGSWAAGATPSRSNPENYKNGTVPWLKTGDLNDGLITAIPESISANAFNTSSVRLNPVGSVLMAMYGATIGKLGILGIEATTNQACCACIPFNGIDNKFLFYFLLSFRKRFIEMGTGGAQPNISKEKIVQATFPLPPLAEQQRIVENLDHFLPLCDSMKEVIDATA